MFLHLHLNKLYTPKQEKKECSIQETSILDVKFQNHHNCELIAELWENRLNVSNNIAIDMIHQPPGPILTANSIVY